MWMGFLRGFLAGPLATGAIAPSSRALAELITDEARLEQARVVVEFGPGTGVVTEQILAKLPAGATFFAMEVNGSFVEATRGRCPGARVIHDSAVNVQGYLHETGVISCDCIVCGLPWAAFPEGLQDDLLGVIEECLSPGGRFLTYAYLQGLLLPAGQRFKKKLHERFPVVRKTPTVWGNLPPAFVYVGDKGM